MLARPTAPCVHIVDDDEAVRDSLAALVDSAGYSVKTYASALELLDSPDGLRAECIVADIRMPDMDGLQLQQELKRRGVSIPFIVITGHADVSLAVQAMKAGAADFLEKPFETERFLSSLTDALERERPRKGTDRAPLPPLCQFDRARARDCGQVGRRPVEQRDSPRAWHQLPHGGGPPCSDHEQNSISHLFSIGAPISRRS